MNKNLSITNYVFLQLMCTKSTSCCCWQNCEHLANKYCSEIDQQEYKLWKPECRNIIPISGIYNVIQQKITYLQEIAESNFKNVSF